MVKCKKCGAVVWGGLSYCDVCLKDFKLDNSKKVEESIKKKSWKNKWESINKNSIFHKTPITNPHSAAIIYYLFFQLLFTFFFPVVFILLDLNPIVIINIITKTALIFVYAITFYRLVYFIFIRIKKNKLNVRNSILKIKSKIETNKIEVKNNLKKNINYCSQCGIKRKRNNDKFCVSCGNKFL